MINSLNEGLNLALLVLLAITSFILFAIFLFLFIKVISFVWLKPKLYSKELAHLVKDKHFTTRDGYFLHWQGQIKKEGQIIILGVHDLGLDKNEFQRLSNQFAQQEKISFVSFDQRYFGQNDNSIKDRRTNYTLSDLKEIITYLKNNNPIQKIYLLGSGFGANLVSYFMKENNSLIHGIILVNMNSLIPNLTNSFNFHKLMKGILLSPTKVFLKLPFDGLFYSNQVELVENINNLIAEKGFINVREFYQIKTILNRSLKLGPKITKPVLVLQTVDDIFSTKKKADKFFQSLIATKQHILFHDDFHGLLLNKDFIISQQIETWLNSI